MRLLVMLSMFLALACPLHSAERLQGFLTLGCDTFIRPHDAAETWKVYLPAERRAELVRMAGIVVDSNSPWLTLYVDIEGDVTRMPQEGYLGRHAKSVRLTRIYSARYPERGETTNAAIRPAKAYRGFLLVGPHGAGFIPLVQKDELWWVIARGTSWSEIVKFFPRQQNALEQAEVRVVGQVGPPGAYGAMNDYSREIALDELHFVRRVRADVLAGTAGLVSGDTPPPAINRCAALSPEAQ